MKKGQIFEQIQINAPQGNWFDLTHDVKLSTNMGYIVPTCVIDVLPGDVFKIGFENLLRFSPLIAPIMHRVKVTTHYFFVPNRILWEDWGDWIAGNLDVEPPFTYPSRKRVSGTSNFRIQQGSIADYMGLPLYNESTSSSTPINAPKLNALPFSAYAKIISEYYIDQNNTSQALQDRWKAYTELVNGDNSALGATALDTNGFSQAFTSMFPFPRAWQHDYFTSTLPWAQKGDQVMLPIADFNDVPVTFNWDRIPAPQRTGGNLMKASDGNINTLAINSTIANSTTGKMQSPNVLYYDPNGSLFADTSELEAASASINNLRIAFRLQEWLEKNARGGTRYTESILSHFGVRSSDARLQRPEYLGGAVQNMVVSEVLSTAQTLNSTNQVTNPVGQMAGHGLSIGGSRVLNYRSEEHGWIIGLLSIMPDTAYYQGIHKKFSKFDRLEYFWPTFAHLGEQEVKNKEVFIGNTTSQAVQEQTFGYIPRYAEYRFENNRVAGEFRTTLDFWHLGRKFANQPSLNEAFIYPYTPAEIDNPPVSPFDRIFAVNSSQANTVYAHVLNKITARRLMPIFGTPSF